MSDGADYLQQHIEDVMMQIAIGVQKGKVMPADVHQEAVDLMENIERWSGQQRQKAVDEAACAYGACTKCYGKGYATTIHYSSGHDTDTDIGSPGGHYKSQNNVMRYCDCDRGKQLMGIPGVAVADQQGPKISK
jgi:hypothetical protein